MRAAARANGNTVSEGYARCGNGRKSKRLLGPQSFPDRASKADILAMAATIMEKRGITWREFDSALNGILTYADNLGSWELFVDLAYRRMPDRYRPSTRFLMMSYRNGLSDFRGVLSLVPGRFCGSFGLVELAYAMEAALSLNDIKVAIHLATRLPRAIREADHPVMKSHLLGLLKQHRAGL